MMIGYSDLASDRLTGISSGVRSEPFNKKTLAKPSVKVINKILNRKKNFHFNPFPE